jgi:hypothetical protein
MTRYYLDIRKFQVTLTAQPSSTGTPPRLFDEPVDPLFPDRSIGHRQPLL